MRRKNQILVVIGLLTTLFACHTYSDLPSYSVQKNTDWKTQRIEAEPQITNGDAERGFDYILNGDYVGGGIPYGLFKKRGAKIIKKVGKSNPANEDLPYFTNVFETQNGTKVVTGNCFTCHAAPLDGEIYLGIGNYASDYRANLSSFGKVMTKVVNVSYGKESTAAADFQDFNRYLSAIAPAIETDQIGSNPAARLAEACMQHRNPCDLTYTAEEQYPSDDFNIACDVPPLWHVKKKNALYYNANGKGDFTKLLMQASVLGIPDSTYARAVQKNFVDVLAWLESLEPPKYPYEVDASLANEGKALFEKNCSSCHGTYGEKETYPNKVVNLNLLKTDSLYATYALSSNITDWYNKSWFATSQPRSRLEPHYGYIAPPLDGIWATAPYLHNGSVPTIDALLNSKTRPTYWNRNIENYEFDEVKVGWQYKGKGDGSGKMTYDTTIPGYGNGGHYFGDKLKDEERKAVLEYLKTL
ncbi:MAG: c-type cytochrome [Bacteroidota bacterium]